MQAILDSLKNEYLNKLIHELSTKTFIDGYTSDWDKIINRYANITKTILIYTNVNGSGKFDKFNLTIEQKTIIIDFCAKVTEYIKLVESLIHYQIMITTCLNYENDFKEAYLKIANDFTFVIDIINNVNKGIVYFKIKEYNCIIFQNQKKVEHMFKIIHKYVDISKCDILNYSNIENIQNICTLFKIEVSVFIEILLTIVMIFHDNSQLIYENKMLLFS